MRRRYRTAAAVLATGTALALVPVAPASADKDYRTQKYAVTGAGLPGGGWVLNVHTEGGVNYGIERYQLRHVEPGTYLVELAIHEDDGCTEQLLPAFQTALLATNAAGNAQGGAKFLAEAVAPLIPAAGTVYGRWTFTALEPGGPVYSTGCEAITLDVP